MKSTDIKSTEYGGYFKRYLDEVSPDVTLADAYQKGKDGAMISYYDSIPKEKLSYKYAEDKWTLLEVYQHVIDTERVFSHRMFRIGRMDTTPLPNFDQDIYIDPSGANHKTLEQLHYEYRTTRANTTAIVNSLTDAQLAFIGEASNHPMSPRTAAFLILGHEKWHVNINNERYL